MVFSQVYTHEDEDREQDVPNDDDNLSDIKEDLVDESNNGRPGSAGEKSDADDKTGKNISRVAPLSRLQPQLGCSPPASALEGPPGTR